LRKGIGLSQYSGHYEGESHGINQAVVKDIVLN
jgi:hypothetical protein